MTHFSDIIAILRCPRCGSAIDWEGDRITCGNQHAFPVRFGIPDFRVSPDPYISIEDEIVKVERMVNHGRHTFKELVDRYYALTPEVAPELQQRYKQGLLAGERRGEHFIAWIEERLGSLEAPLLDIGCGTSGLLLAAQRRHIQACGVDIALRWLVIGRQRLREAGCEPLLLCANAEALPFSQAAFGAVLSDSTLEHIADSARALSETIRVCEPGAVFAVRTVNERSLVEPYTGFPLPWLLPRKFRNQVIAKICRTPYLLQPPSSFVLMQFLKTHSFLKLCAYLPLFDYQAKRNRRLSFFLKVYQRLSESRAGNALLRRIGLFLCIYGRLPGKGT